jgi:hypothetical protein
MGGTPAGSNSTTARARKAAERLEELAALQARARARLDRNRGFITSLDDATIEAHLQSDQPEMLGTWPEPQADSDV